MTCWPADAVNCECTIAWRSSLYPAGQLATADTVGDSLMLGVLYTHMHILKVWYHIKNLTLSIDYYLLQEQSCQISSMPLAFLKVSPQQQTNKHHHQQQQTAIWDQFLSSWSKNQTVTLSVMKYNSLYFISKKLTHALFKYCAFQYQFILSTQICDLISRYNDG